MANPIYTMADQLRFFGFVACAGYNITVHVVSYVCMYTYVQSLFTVACLLTECSVSTVTSHRSPSNAEQGLAVKGRMVSTCTCTYILMQNFFFSIADFVFAPAFRQLCAGSHWA